MSIYYRYRCSIENAHVTEKRSETAAAPTVCKNDGSTIVANTLTVVDEPLYFGDVVFQTGDDLDLTGASVSGLSHTLLTNIGTNSHVCYFVSKITSLVGVSGVGREETNVFAGTVGRAFGRRFYP